MRLIDSHVHLFSRDNIENLNAVREHIGAERMVIVCCVDAAEQENSAAFAAKARYPGRFHVFAALDHSGHRSLVDQVDMLIRAGADGIKLLETKPDSRKALGIAADTDYFEPFFARVEQLGIPLIWHAADPPEFWQAELTPKWAADRGWAYDETFPSYEQILGEVEHVLERHPKLQVVFAHFLFLSADLPRAARLLNRYEGVRFDIAPGIELCYNLSRDVGRAREFFIEYADRIIFGTDIWDALTLEQAAHRAGILVRFLKTADEFRVPEGADELLGPPEEGIIHGLDLPEDALAKIFAANIERLLERAPAGQDNGNG